MNSYEKILTRHIIYISPTIVAHEMINLSLFNVAIYRHKSWDRTGPINSDVIIYSRRQNA